LDDLVRVASGAVGTVVGLRDEAGLQMRERFDRVLAKSEMVSREEFEIVREMASIARSEQEELAERLSGLEAKLADVERPTDPNPVPRRRTTRTTRTRRTRSARKPAAK